MSSSDTDPGCLVGGAIGFALIGGLILAIGLSAVKLSIEKTAWWEDAVSRGYAEKVTHSGGEGYRWKESNENTTDR